MPSCRSSLPSCIWAKVVFSRSLIRRKFICFLWYRKGIEIQKMSFKTPDGKEFETKAEWRDYMMSQYYSFKNKVNEKSPCIKNPGDVDGQVFDMADCSNSTLIMMDRCAQSQIDEMINCKVLVGACEASIFIRDCKNCTFFVACKQLRIRDCIDCIIYCYSMSEVHIELSSGLKFAHLNSAYPEQMNHFKQCKLDPSRNYWYDIFDHSDPDKSGKNWSLLPPKEYDEPWYPAGECSIFVATKKGKLGTALAGQVGESFGRDTMIADANKSSTSAPSSVPKPQVSPKAAAPPVPTPAPAPIAPKPTSSSIPIETALVVEAAIQRGIDVGTWLGEGQDDMSTVRKDEFRVRMHSLMLVVAVDEDDDSKVSLEEGVSPSTLDDAVILCSKDAEANWIDIPKFVMSCSQIVQRYLRGESEELAQELAAKEKETEPAPESQEIDTDNYMKNTYNVTGNPVETRLPSSPYDEEVAFDLAQEDDVDSAHARRALRKKPTTVLADNTRPRPSSARATRFGSVDGKAPSSRLSTGKSYSRPKTAPVIVPKPPAPQSLDPQSVELQAQVEDMLFDVVKKTDQYHRLQVHLGFIAPYLIMPDRGIPVKSTPQQWLGVTDLQRASNGARLFFSEIQIFGLIRLLKNFAAELRAIEKNQISGNVALTRSGKPLCKQPVVYKRRVNAEWLRRYLVHLRLKKRVKPFHEWLGEKVEQAHIVNVSKPKEFMRALAGRAHRLSTEEVNRKLDSYEILPEPDMLFEIQQRVECWVNDTNGRRDYQHKLNIEIRKHCKSEQINYNRLPASDKKDLRRQLGDKLVAEKQSELKQSEESGAAITKDLYWKFDAACRESNYKLGLTFGDWLKRYREKCTTRLSNFKKHAEERRRIVGEKVRGRHTVASIAEVTGRLDSIAEGMDTKRSIELRKNLVALRRAAETAGHAQGTLVTKEDFDRHLENVLAPCVKLLPPDIQDLTKSPRASLEGPLTTQNPQNIDMNMFYTNEKEAATRALRKAEEEQSKNQVRFKAWADRKDEERRTEKEKIEFEEKQKLKEKSDRTKQAKKAYKQWLKLRRSRKYVSTVDGRTRPLPDGSKVRHNTKWNKDVELNEYYLKQEEEFM